MRFLFVTLGPSLIPLATMIKREDHKVQVLSESAYGSGTVPHTMCDRVTIHAPHEGYDIGITDVDSSVRERLHNKQPTIGPTIFTKNLIHHPEVAIKAFALADVLAAPRKLFTVDETSALREHVSEDRPMSVWWRGERKLVSDDGWWIFAYAMSSSKGPVTIMEHPPGIEIVVGGWFNGHKFIRPVVSQLWSEDATVKSGWVYNHTPRIFQEGPERMTSLLRKADYRGPFALRGHATSTDVCWTDAICDMRATSIFLDGTTDVAGLISSVARGEGTWHVRQAFYLGITFSHLYSSWQLPLPLSEGCLRHLQLEKVRKDPDGQIRILGNPVGTVTAWGRRLEEARKRVKRTIRSMDVPDLKYDKDLDRGMGTKWEKLEKWAWM